MKPETLFCQDCGLKYDNLSSYKTHAFGNLHQKKVAEVFHIVPHNGKVNFPHLTMEYLSRPNRTYPVIGLQLMSLCISTTMDGVPFYLCHACQEKCQSSAVLSHLKSAEHYFSVFAYMNPERLNFGWFQPPENVPGLKAKAVEEEKQQGPGVLGVIDMPKKVFENLKRAPYSQTMNELTHTDKLKEVFRVDKPERMTLQEYLRNPSRTHPLLGLNFLVEYRSVDSSNPCRYLCLLCKKRVRETQVISHVIGFNHLFWYLDRVHPSTLLSKSSYTFYTEKYSLRFLDLAKQAQEIGTSGKVQEMKLDPEDFAAANTGSFANALDLLQVIQKEANQSDLRPHVTPGQRLVFKEMAQSPGTSLEPAVGDQQNMTEPDKAGQRSTVVAKSGGNSRLSCLVCAPGALFLYMSEYKKHLRGNKHQRRMEFLFQTELHRTTVPVPTMVVYECVKNPRRTDPVIGLQLVTACIETELVKTPLYLCHTCQDKCTSHVIMTHLTSSDHYFCTLAFMHPERLHFGWIPSQDMLSILRPQVQAVEKQHGSGVLQVLDMPENFSRMIATTPYLPTMRALCQTEELYERLRVRKWIKLETYLTDPNRKHPMIGLNFLVEYTCMKNDNLCGYLCLLCKKRVRETLVIAHIIGFDHLFWYLDVSHPSSLGSKSLYKHYDAWYSSMILDLATQAEKIDSSGKVQRIELEPAIYDEVDSTEFLNALNKLQMVWKETNQSNFQPLVTPGPRLVLKEQTKAPSSKPNNLAQSSEPQNSSQSSEPQNSSQSSDLLWTYLKNKERSEPVIGLSAVIEFATHNLPPYYLCEACTEQMAQDCVIDHLISSTHRYCYLKLKHLLSHWEEISDLTKKIEALKERAAALEKEEGFGEAQVLELDPTQYKEIFSSSIDVALNSLQTIQKEQMQSCLQPLLIPGQRLVTVEEEMVQSEVTPQTFAQVSESTEYPLQKLGASSHFTVAKGRSELSKVLCTKKKKKKRKRRKSLIIGLREVTECSSANQDTVYFCHVCRAKISKFHISYHIVGVQHHYNYIKAYYPSWLEREVKNAHLPSMSEYLLKLAEIVKEKEGGNGDVQVVKLDVELYKKLTSMSADSAVKNLQIWKEQSQNKDQTEQKGMKDFQHSLEPPPKQPCLPNPHEGAVNEETEEWAGSSEASRLDDFRVPPETDADKKETVQIQAILQNPECTEPNTVTVKQKVLSPACPEEALQVTQLDKQYQGRQGGDVEHDLELGGVTVKQEQIESEICSEEPMQDLQHINTEQATNAKEVNAQKLIQGPKPHDTQPFTVEENVTQSPAPPEQSVLGLKSTEMEQVAVEQVEIHAGLQDPGLIKATTAPLHGENVCWQMSSCISFQDPRMSAAKRVAVPVGESHLSKFMLSFMTGKQEPLIGLGAVVECRSFKQPTFYLCLTCTMKINKNCICNHVISGDHQQCYIESLYPDLVSDWLKNPTDVAWWLEDHEKIWDVQVMKMDLSLYENVASAPFDLALALLQVTRRENNQSYLRPLVTSGKRLIIVHNWGVPHQEAPEKLHQDPSRTESQREALIEWTVQHQETPLDQEQDPDCTELACVSEKWVQSSGHPQKPSQDLKEVERQRVTAEHGGAQQEPMETPQSADQAKVNTEAAAQASPLEPWPRLKDSENVPVERAGRSSLDLRAYVNDPQRTQPVVGLNALIECCSEHQPPLYLCVACSTQLNKTPVICHVISNKHRLSYLGSRRPDLFMCWNNCQDSAKMFSNLMEIAREVEREEQSGVREIQEVSLDSAAYTDVKSMPFPKALDLLQTICKKQGRSNLQPFVTPGQRLLTVKQEQIEWQACPEQPRQFLQHIDAEQGRAGEKKPTPVEMVTHRERQSDSGAKTPVIGLQLVIECRKVEGRPPPCFYLCQACSVKLTGDQRSINKHLTSAQHQYFYIKSCHPSRLEVEKKAGRMLCGMTDLVQFVAKRLEEEEGSGSFQVMNISEGIYEKLKQGNYEDCMKMLKGCVDENRTSSKIREGNIIQHTDSTGVTLPYLTALWGPGPTSYVCHDSPTTLSPPIVSNSALLAKMTTKEMAGQRLWPNHLESPGDLAAHCPSSRPPAPHQLDHASHRTSKPWSLNSLSPTRPAYSPRDTLSHCPAVATQLPSERVANRHHPSQTATSSRAASTRRSDANEDVVQGEQISTVGRLLSPAADKGLSTTDARKRKHHREESRDEAPWNYENRQFSFCPRKTSVSQSKRHRGVHDPRGSAPDLHLSDGAPRPTGAQTHRASGDPCGGNIVNSTTIRRPFNSDPPPGKIPGLDYNDSQEGTV